MAKDLYEIGEIPPLGEVPARMHAQVIRPERFGEPRDAFEVEAIEVPEVGPHEVLVLVMAAGVNYNNVWAALGIPVDVTRVHGKNGEPRTSTSAAPTRRASCRPSATRSTTSRSATRWSSTAACGTSRTTTSRKGLDPGFHDSYRIWGYETNWGTFAQFTKVQDHQCLPKPAQLTWEEAAAYMLVGATAYRMLIGWPPNIVREGDPVLIWGGAGGLGSMAIQIVQAAGGRPVAVVSGEEQGEFCKKLGAVGVINRREFDHWGKLPHWTDDDRVRAVARRARARSARRSGTRSARSRTRRSCSSTPARTRCRPRSSCARRAAWS